MTIEPLITKKRAEPTVVGEVSGLLLALHEAHDDLLSKSLAPSSLSC